MAKVQKVNSDFSVGVNPARDYRFILNLSYPGRTASVKQQIVDMTLNGSGVRDIARVLHVSTRTVIAELKKSRCA
jgi:transposase-like protein